jgi:hypothetical protein
MGGFVGQFDEQTPAVLQHPKGHEIELHTVGVVVATDVAADAVVVASVVVVFIPVVVIAVVEFVLVVVFMLVVEFCCAKGSQMVTVVVSSVTAPF